MQVSTQRTRVEDGHELVEVMIAILAGVFPIQGGNP
jgi:hypothetical protein